MRPAGFAGRVGLIALLLCCGAIARAQSRMDDANGDAGESSNAPDQSSAKDRKLTEDARAFRNAPAVVQSGPVDPAQYFLGPGDVLELDLWGRISSNTLLPVSPEGTIFLPGSGPFSVSGRTLSWARQRMLDLVAQNMRGVRAEVRLVQLRVFKVFVTGVVSHPGAVGANSVSHASEIVSSLGLEPGASRRNIEVRRLDGTKQRLDLELFEALGRQDFDPRMVDGDVIAVPKATRFIGVAGAVSRPGRYELAPGDSLSTLLALGGGPLPSAALDRALMIRFPTPSQRETVWVDLESVPTGKQNFPLADGDQIFIQSRADYHLLPSVATYGEVERPGAYPIMVGRDRLSDLIRWAGGFRPFANRSAIQLLRETPVESEKDPEFERLVRLTRSEMTESEYAKFQTMLAERKNVFRVDWARIQKENVDVDPLLQPGDVVRVEQLVPTIRVEGEVRHPGLVDFVQGRSLREYIELAGGYSEHASRANIRIARALTGQVLPARTVASIQPGDFVWVPERKDVDAWEVFRDAIAVVGQVAVVIFTLSR